MGGRLLGHNSADVIELQSSRASPKSIGLEKFDKIPCREGLHGERGNKTGVS